MLNVIFKKSDFMKKKSVNKILFFNIMIKEIDEQKSFIAIIEYIQKKYRIKKRI